MKGLFWFNTNIDKIAGVGQLPDIGQPEKPDEITSMEGLVSAVKYSMKQGIGYEQISSWTPAGIKFKSRLGGTSAIMANYLSYKGWKSYIKGPMLSQNLASLFQAKSRIFFWGRKKWVRSDKFRGGRSKSNFIFEFRKGDKIGDVVASGSSRFILATDPPEYEPDFSIPQGFDFYFLSGFHNISKKFDIDIPENSHIELTTIKRKWMLKKVRELTYDAWSVGMDYNESEAMFGARTKDEIVQFLEETDHSAVVIHADGFFIGMWRKGMKMEKALESAACASAAYASSYRLMKRPCRMFRKSKHKKQTIKLKDRTISIVPYRIVENPVRTTGMGDVISAESVRYLLS